MNRIKLWAGISLSLISIIVAGCGGSGNGPTGTSGQLSGTLTREVLLGNAPELGENATIRLPEVDYAVLIYQGSRVREVLRTDAQGRFTLSLPAGSYLVKPSDEILERTPAIIGTQTVTVSSGQTATVDLEITIPTP